MAAAHEEIINTLEEKVPKWNQMHMKIWYMLRSILSQ